MPNKFYANSTDNFTGLNVNDQAPGENDPNNNTTDSNMDINDNSQEPGKANVNDAHNDQHDTALAKINISPEHQYDH